MLYGLLFILWNITLVLKWYLQKVMIWDIRDILLKTSNIKSIYTDIQYNTIVKNYIHYLPLPIESQREKVRRRETLKYCHFMRLLGLLFQSWLSIQQNRKSQSLFVYGQESHILKNYWLFEVIRLQYMIIIHHNQILFISRIQGWLSKIYQYNWLQIKVANSWLL